jgi:ribosomal protein S18 acetylase RimI-like enzyme
MKMTPMRPAGSLTSKARNTIVRRLLEQDARAYRAVLLEALIVRPECFPRHNHEEMSRPLEDIERQLAAEIILGAWIKDELVGIVAFAAKSFPKQRHAGTISHLYVKERFRRKGVAGLLLGAVLESAAHHVEQVEIIVSDITEDVIALFERFGFRICGLMPRGIRIDGEDVDTWIMVLVLR